ncbi:acyl CoA:acetate/3-ketoacid CoA transferase [Variovorax sp. Sphag1AA]|uniref:acyl CoA:acetate/3-ketoacid CoA transferase n=1 Tax=Variovorax sp. Sphag1AA TaxID=2587027 RepID=UPI00160CCDB4|nr:malonate decarboxylase subunit alpha [Variovorax sp. Sphag1AA]MBB3178729.1 propionate CoA-transferase [Variovorax sp. Sphag1AA]
MTVAPACTAAKERPFRTQTASRIITAAQAAELVEDGTTVVCAGFVGAGHPEAVTAALEKRFLATGSPRGLTLMYAAGQGDRMHRGVNHFGNEGMTTRIIGSHWMAAPRLGALVARNAVHAYNWPQGVIAHLYRATAGGKPGVITRVGLHTFVDPRIDGGRLTPDSPPIVQLMKIGDDEHLFFPTLPVHVALIRATTADEHGNLTTEHEPFHQDLLVNAQAAHNSGGIVIAQVKRIVPAGTLDPNLVRVPGILVDHIVLTEDPADHWMTYAEEMNPAYTQAAMHAGPAPAAPAAPPPLDVRSIIQRRAVMELLPLKRPVVNLGAGMPAGIGIAARAEGLDNITLTLEAGPIGGTPALGLSFGASAYPQAIIDQAAMFDFYDGGGIDIAFLGMAQLDSRGNVNVSRFGGTLAGIGGFINISQSARRVVLMGAFSGGGLRIKAQDGTLHIEREGDVPKLLEEVEHLSFNGAYAQRQGIQVTYVTERAVFELRDGRLTMTEIAPGLDPVRDVLARCRAGIAVADRLRLMPTEIFREGPMGLKAG